MLCGLFPSHPSQKPTREKLPADTAAQLLSTKMGFPIASPYLTIGRYKQAVIGPKGMHDFYVQLHTRPDFRSCDDCPHETNGQSV